ncbi:MAG: hypothetical protein HOC22_03450 [Cryomorphaceae bacterium]|nr:hypothetical protein [Cryomorphaceae bacterium]MDG1889392.1 hypothetical protein [Flavobacteriaceae bacterium]MBT3502929.1 hypothetical protein [Cryomorphaceae bacterium]MBT3688704.1 hypothetical protein [Cryomorphaceae bacterium]MBT4222590.1 hypothetical protein [Cryomorphaceae bacterium]
MFKLNKNRRFNYTPRFFKGKEDIPINFESKFSKYRDTYNSIDMGMNWSDQRDKMRNKRNRGINMTLILIVVFLILVFLYIIDFDLTIFYTN